MANQEIKVGKTYTTKGGDKVQIISSSFGMYEYKGSNGKQYDDDGRTDFFRESLHDLDLSVPTGDEISQAIGDLAIAGLKGLTRWLSK